MKLTNKQERFLAFVNKFTAQPINVEMLDVVVERQEKKMKDWNKKRHCKTSLSSTD